VTEHFVSDKGLASIDLACHEHAPGYGAGCEKISGYFDRAMQLGKWAAIRDVSWIIACDVNSSDYPAVRPSQSVHKVAVLIRTARVLARRVGISTETGGKNYFFKVIRFR
jgi:hypothetical protein